VQITDCVRVRAPNSKAIANRKSNPNPIASGLPAAAALCSGAACCFRFPLSAGVLLVRVRAHLLLVVVYCRNCSYYMAWVVSEGWGGRCEGAPISSKQPPAEGHVELITGHPETKASHSRSACVVTSRLWERDRTRL
jgi:hypothetical protein